VPFAGDTYPDPDISPLSVKDTQFDPGTAVAQPALGLMLSVGLPELLVVLLAELATIVSAFAENRKPLAIINSEAIFLSIFTFPPYPCVVAE